MRKTATSHDQNGGSSAPQYAPQQMYYYNPAMMQPHGHPPATTASVSVAGEKSAQSTTPPQQQPFVPHPAAMEQFAQLQACYYPPTNPAGYLASATPYPVAVTSYGATNGTSGYPNSGSSYLSRGKPPMQTQDVTSPPLLPTCSNESSISATIGVGGEFTTQSDGSPHDEKSAKRKRLSNENNDRQPNHTVSNGQEYEQLQEQEQELEKRRKVTE